MKLLDKIKDLFMDEVAEDEEIELEEDEREEYKEPPRDVLPTVMRQTIEKEEEKKVELRSKKVESQGEKVNGDIPLEPAKKFSFPIDFEDDISLKNSNKTGINVNVLKREKENIKKVSELYPKKEEVVEKPKFKATPVISPVYGILDKNYRKEEVKEKSEETSIMKRPSKKVDFETVRKKAFGNLADEIKDNLMCENCELYKEVKKISALKEDDLLYDMTIDEEKDVTIEKAYDDYEEFGVAYEPMNKHDDRNDEVVISDVNQVEEVVVENNALNEEINESSEEIPSRSDREKKVSEEKKTKVDADFFELIDSMYKERSDE